MKSKKNKSNLIDWLFNYWRESFQSNLILDQTIIFCHNDGSATEITPSSSQTLPFQCDHVEVDSKMFVYLHYVSLKHDITRIISNFPDTDVTVIACHQFTSSFQHVQEMWFKTGTGQKGRYIPTHKVVENLGATASKMVPILYTITGCNSTSSFSGTGKNSAFSTLKKYSPLLLDLINFDEEPNLQIDSESSICEIKFVCLLHDENFKSCDINALRYKLFTKKGITGDKLPPTLNSQLQHFRRANYQTYIWKNSIRFKLELPSPCENGWKMDGETLTLIHEYMLSQPVPEIMVMLVRCKCKKSCSTIRCSCRKTNLSCKDAYLCNENDDCVNL